MEQDQCKAEMRQGRVFQNLREGVLSFPPTYKFNKNNTDPLGYDTSEKRRVPAWCDRIFFRGTLRRDIPEVSTPTFSFLESIARMSRGRCRRQCRSWNVMSRTAVDCTKLSALLWQDESAGIPLIEGFEFEEQPKEELPKVGALQSANRCGDSPDA